jgi:hypothetical protein
VIDIFFEIFYKREFYSGQNPNTHANLIETWGDLKKYGMKILKKLMVKNILQI